MSLSDMSEQSMNRLNIGPVHGSDLIPLKRIYQPNMTSYNKKRERRERHIKQMLKQRVRQDTGLSGMTSALFELAVNSTDIIDFTLVELWRQVKYKFLTLVCYSKLCWNN